MDARRKILKAKKDGDTDRIKEILMNRRNRLQQTALQIVCESNNKDASMVKRYQVVKLILECSKSKKINTEFRQSRSLYMYKVEDRLDELFPHHEWIDKQLERKKQVGMPTNARAESSLKCWCL